MNKIIKTEGNGFHFQKFQNFEKQNLAKKISFFWCTISDLISLIIKIFHQKKKNEIKANACL